MSELLTKNKSETETPKRSFFEAFLKPMQGDASWSVVTAIYFALASASTTLFSAFHYLNSIPLSGFIVLGFFILSLIFTVLAYYLGNRQRTQIISQTEPATIGSNVIVSDITKSKRPGFVLIGIAVIALLVAFLIGRFTNTSTSTNANANINASANSNANINTFTNFNADAKLIEIKNKSFLNERVLLDGHSYKDCTFTNVKFVYNGTTPTVIIRSYFKGVNAVASDNPVVNSTAVMMKGLGFAKDGFQIMDDGKPAVGVEPPTIIPPSQNQ
jgi:hypothetical protein